MMRIVVTQVGSKIDTGSVSSTGGSDDKVPFTLSTEGKQLDFEFGDIGTVSPSLPLSNLKISVES